MTSMTSNKTHEIPMLPAKPSRTDDYGVLHSSAFVYQTSRGSGPTRIDVWDNTRRPNARNGEPLRWGQCGVLDGGNGRYLDPENQATDETVSVLLTPECTVIDAYGTGTGSAASGQVYSPDGETIRSGDTLMLMYPDGTHEARVVRFTGNGHGQAALAG